MLKSRLPGSAGARGADANDARRGGSCGVGGGHAAAQEMNNAILPAAEKHEIWRSRSNGGKES